ncbi:transglycosylase family protein [Streptomyces sp. HMX87]|uniref:transglycosylase family protein n=1 Tax=Streptomyces sp. HMX87 TaxID=3390849 RepID=UPI003A8A8C34
MLSGNGRHRRPRQAPALVVAAGVTGSAIAIPLLGASGASAADGAAWDRVAECETGGAWSQNSGNGYYGGLQLPQEKWEQYGGLAYASSADQASRSQQIRVAEKLLAAEGITAWPTCGLLAGLENDSPSAVGGGTADDGSSDATPTAPTSPTSPTSDASGTPGATTESAPETAPESVPASPTAPDPDASASTAAPTPSGTPTNGTDESPKSDTSGENGSPAATATDSATAKRDDSDNSGQGAGSSDLTDTGQSGTGRHRGESADEGAGDGRTGESAGRHASRGDAAVRDAADGTYTVRSGDSLWGIADSLELDGGWRALYAANEEAVGADPDHILPGQTLAVRVESGEK